VTTTVADASGADNMISTTVASKRIELVLIISSPPKNHLFLAFVGKTWQEVQQSLSPLFSFYKPAQRQTYKLI
jgi:hypothetical protein